MRKLKVLGEELKVKFSHSFMVKAACPRALKLGYVDRDPSKMVRMESARGNAIHDAIAELTDECIAKKVQPSDVSDADIRVALKNNTPTHLASEAGLLFKWTRLWRDKYQFDFETHYGHEEKAAIAVTKDGYEQIDDFHSDDVDFRGILDVVAVNGTHGVVTDYKSQAFIESDAELEEHSQLTFYAWLLWKMYGFLETFTVRIWYLRYGFYKETRRTIDDLEAFEQELRLREEMIMSIKDWEPVSGPQCNMCDYMHKCDLAKNLNPDFEEIVTLAQAQMAFSKTVAMGNYLKHMKTKMRSYVKGNDSVRMGGLIYGFREVRSVSYDTKKMRDFLPEHGHDVMDLVSPNGREIKKVRKKAAKFNTLLNESFGDAEIEEVSTRFEFYKAPDDDVD